MYSAKPIKAKSEETEKGREANRGGRRRGVRGEEGREEKRGGEEGQMRREKNRAEEERGKDLKDFLEMRKMIKNYELRCVFKLFLINGY